MIAISEKIRLELEHYLAGSRISPLFLLGDALDVLSDIPDETFDMVMTSPPYWGKREYDNGGIGLEKHYGQFIFDLLAICTELKRVLKSTGSFWLNIGDSYEKKKLLGIPSSVRVAALIALGYPPDSAPNNCSPRKSIETIAAWNSWNDDALS